MTQAVSNMALHGRQPSGKREQDPDQEAGVASARAGRGARGRTRNIRPGRQRPGTQPERAPAVPAPTAEAAVTADHPEGRAGTGPGGPADSAPYRFTDKPGECRCPDCEQCPCFSQHVSNVCACCRAGLHDRTCGPPPVRLVKAGQIAADEPSDP